MTDPIEGAPGAAAAARQQRLKQACVQLEGVFMNELAKALRETVPEDGALPGSTGGDMFASMLDEKLAELAAARSRSGIATALLQQLGKHA